MPRFNEEQYAHMREAMLQTQILNRNITDEKVVTAMRKIPRHLFVTEDMRAEAYEDKPISITEHSILSQPYLVALMLEALHLSPHDKVLEIGTGSGYETALLCELTQTVYSVDVEDELIVAATKRLADIGFRNFFLKCGDGYDGWPRRSPFDAIVVTAACDEVPRELTRQLGEFGRMIFPLDGEPQFLVLVEKKEGELNTTELCPVDFAPLRSAGERSKH